MFFALALFAVFFALAGPFFLDDDSDSFDLAQALPAFFSFDIFVPGPAVSAVRQAPPALRESFVSYLEMREKSPPALPFSA